jgi:hypothetical protein
MYSIFINGDIGKTRSRRDIVVLQVVYCGYASRFYPRKRRRIVIELVERRWRNDCI